MGVSQVLDQLLKEAKCNLDLKLKLMETRKQKDPMIAFCRAATESGYQIYPGELLAEGEAFCSNLHKSVNGGACYPMEGWDDLYEMFFAQLEADRLFNDRR